MNDYIIKMGQVESVTDEADGLRIKARISQDGTMPLFELPYAFPLLPKTFQVVPKIGECVLIITSKGGNEKTNRYYIGPVISQPQMQEYDPYFYGRGSSISLLQGSSLEPLARISNYANTEGSFPKIGDVAVVGRKSEDIILKDGEIDLRCGIRKVSETNDNNLVGNVVFNRINPSYIQMKFERGLGHSNTQEADSVINLVADKINLVSHKDINSFNLTDKDELIKSKDMDDIMSKLHKVPYGDILVEALEKIRSSILNHVHPYPGLPPCKDHYCLDLSKIDFNKILSDNIRIS